MNMKIPLTLGASLLTSTMVAQSATIAVIDGGGPSAIDTSHTNIVDLSTSGDSIGSITGSFSSDASGWRTADSSHWNNTEWAFDPVAGKTATWTFSNMAAGSEWDVYTTWVTNVNRTTDSPYIIQGGTPIETNQTVSPIADLTLNDGTGGANSFSFQRIGTATVNGSGEIVVTLGSSTSGWTMADAIAIQAVAVPEPSSAALLGLGGLALILRRRK